MAIFDWRQRPDNLRDRYTGDTPGYAAWDRLLARLLDALGLADGKLREAVLRAFDEFLSGLDRVSFPGGAQPCRVFVSHQRADVPYAERIAWRADQQGFEYWLDVHDPLLALANAASPPPIVQSILVAAIIEMALLNCTHVISVQTKNAQGSRWVPYEYGRCKRRMLVSTQVASWFDNGITPGTADYLRLGVCTYSELAVEQWLIAERTRSGYCAPAGNAWQGLVPEPLPN
jgi:hypothetical protein